MRVNLDFTNIHRNYCRLTGMELTLTMNRIYAWEAWSAKGWTEKDLSLVVFRLKQLIKQNRKWPSSLHFRRLIEDLDGFEEMLSEARAEGRRPRADADRASVLRATGRVAVEQERVETPAQVMQRMKMLDQLRQWRKENAG